MVFDGPSIIIILIFFPWSITFRPEKSYRSSKSSGMIFKGLSLGYSSFPADGGTLSELLHMADLRMYQRKKEKHRVTELRSGGRW